MRGSFNYSWELLRKPTSCSSSIATDVIAVKEKVLSWTYIFFFCSLLIHFGSLFFIFFQHICFDYSMRNKMYPYNRPYPEHCAAFLHGRECCSKSAWKFPLTLSSPSFSSRWSGVICKELCGVQVYGCACNGEMRSRHAREKGFIVNLFKKCVCDQEKDYDFHFLKFSRNSGSWLHPAQIWKWEGNLEEEPTVQQ